MFSGTISILAGSTSLLKKLSGGLYLYTLFVLRWGFGPARLQLGDIAQFASLIIIPTFIWQTIVPGMLRGIIRFQTGLDLPYGLIPLVLLGAGVGCVHFAVSKRLWQQKMDVRADFAGYSWLSKLLPHMAEERIQQLIEPALLVVAGILIMLATGSPAGAVITLAGLNLAHCQMQIKRERTLMLYSCWDAVKEREWLMSGNHQLLDSLPAEMREAVIQTALLNGSHKLPRWIAERTDSPATPTANGTAVVNANGSQQSAV